MTRQFWFSESDIFSKDFTPKFLVKSRIASQKSKYQKIEILDTFRFGKILVLDGTLQLTEKDEFMYHEMLVHVPMLTHKNPKKILIIGGGDGGALREVLKHKIDKVVMVEIDRDVIGYSRKYLKIDESSFNDKHLELNIGDAYDYVKLTKDKFDIIIDDATDPVGGASENLFSKEFYSNIKRILAKDGIFVMNVGVPVYYTQKLSEIVKNIRAYLNNVKLYLPEVPSFGGLWPIAIFSKKYNPQYPRKSKIATKCYNYEYHISVFTLPKFLAQVYRE